MKIRNLTLLLLMFFIVLPLAGQEKNFTGEIVEVRVVDVPVQVTDSDGNPIVRLKKSDFTLYEDGKIVPISNFFEVKDSSTLRQSIAESYKKSSSRSAAAPEFHKRILIFLDAYHLHPHHYLQVEEGLETFINTTMVPGDQAAIFVATPSIKRILNWTDNLQAIKQALRTFKTAGIGSTTLTLRQRELGRIIPNAGRYQYALMDVRGYANERRYEVLRLIDALKAVIDANHAIPGEKYIIYVGEGVQLIPGLGYFYLLDKYFPHSAALNEATRFDLSKDFQNVGKLAASHGFTMYLVDARGMLFHTDQFDAENSGDDRSLGLDLQGSSESIRTSQDSLVLMAEITGGRAIINTNDFKKGLGRFSLALNHYYSLGFTPAHPRDGKYHRIKVKISDPDFRITFRKGFTDYLPGDLLSTHLKTLLVWKQPPHNPLDFGVAVGKSTRKGRTYLVNIKVLFPKKKIPFTDGKVSLRLGIVTGDKKGKMSDTFIQKLDLLEKMWKDKPVLAVPLKLRMRKGKQVMVVGVEDPFEDISYLRDTINVPTGNK